MMLELIEPLQGGTEIHFCFKKGKKYEDVLKGDKEKRKRADAVTLPSCAVPVSVTAFIPVLHVTLLASFFLVSG